MTQLRLSLALEILCPQAAQILKTPGLANAFTGMNTLTTPENAEKFAFLKDDPELAPVWEEIKTNGPAALQKVRGSRRPHN